jgi:hypothetical protein
LRPGIHFSLGFIISTLLLLTQCQSHKDNVPAALVLKEHTLNSISSGSGLVLYKDSAFIISDDAPFIGRVSLKNNRLERFAIPGWACTIRAFLNR